MLFLSTPSARRATAEGSAAKPEEPISIHALREEGDAFTDVIVKRYINFYPRPPRGGRLPASALPLTAARFLSTPSARRATRSGGHGRLQHQISIHALREEGDSSPLSLSYLYKYFYPRPPRGGRRRLRQRQDWETNFYPRPPRGGRRYAPSRCCVCDAFLSTPSARRATIFNALKGTSGSDFYPRPPRGGRRTAWMEQTDTEIFLSTPSARRATVSSSMVQM